MVWWNWRRILAISGQNLVRLTDKAHSQMQQVKAFFERIDKQLMEDIDEDELLIFEKVLSQLQENIKGIGGENEEIRQTN